MQTWPQGAHVTVNIDPSFGSAQASAIEQAFSNWQAARTANGSGVTFTFTHNSTPPSMQPPPGTYNAQVWNRNHPEFPGKGGASEAHNNGTVTVAQEIWINTQTTDPCAVAQTAAHEIGHGFGLGECPNCPYASSVMVEGDNGYNSSNGTYGPTTCDNNVVQVVGQYPKTKTTGGGGGGKGTTIQNLTITNARRIGGCCTTLGTTVKPGWNKTAGKRGVGSNRSRFKSRVIPTHS